MNQHSICHWITASRLRGLLTWLWVGLGTEAVPLHAAENPNQPGLMAYWKFAPDRQMGDDVKPVAGGMDVTFVGPVRFIKDPGPPRVELPGLNESLTVAPDLSKVLLPTLEMTVEAWVRVDKPSTWGGIFSVVQDNGDFERGWVLGFLDSNFSFGLTTTNLQRLTYLKSVTPFQTNRWYHVAGTYDGTNQSVYVNGELVGQTNIARGPILYPQKAPVMIGSYKDDDEHYRLTGALYSVSLFRRALSAEELRGRYHERRQEFPEPSPAPKPLSLAYGPFVDWDNRDVARITWETDTLMPSRLELEAPSGERRWFTNNAPQGRHELLLTGLKPNLEYHYRIHGPEEAGVRVQSKRYLFDSSFYYEPPSIPAVSNTGPTLSPIASLAARLLRKSGARDGYCLVLGATDGRLALELARQSRMDIVVVDADPVRVANARRTLDEAGVYGVRASVHLAETNALPYGSFVANLIVSESTLTTGSPPPFPAKEVARVLRPAGGMLVLGSPIDAIANAANWDRWLKDSTITAAPSRSADGFWLQFQRGKLPGAGEWSHQYGSTDNTSCSQDELVQGDLQVAWWGDPGPRPMPDRGNRNPAPLSVNGRLFVQGNRVLFGLDAYNGAILWSLSAPEVRRANVTRDCSNMAAAGDRLYVAHGRYCLAFDGQMGVRAQRYEVVEDQPAGAFEWGYLAVSNDWLIGSREKRDSTYLGDDGEWYEDYATDQTSRVTSDRLFSLNPSTGKHLWTYRGGAILNSTITIGDGQILFLESRAAEALAFPSSRIPHEKLTDQFIVALDVRTGKKLWEKGHDFSQCQFMTYLVYSSQTVVVTGTDRNKVFHTFAFSAPSPTRPGGDDLEGAIPGRLLWSDSHKEDKGHHSGHLQHPLVIGTSFYSDQRSFDLVSGKLLRTDLPERRGCGVMSAGKNAVFFRHHFHGMWDLASNKRTQFEGIRTGCWLGLIPSGGMLLAPESSAGCSCTHAIQTSVGYLPKSLSEK